LYRKPRLQYRLIVQRDGKRVRLFTRNGHDWSDRYPRIAEAALQRVPLLVRIVPKSGAAGMVVGEESPARWKLAADNASR
jgi:hypothetical protein